jgi:hypothetical protein
MNLMKSYFINLNVFPKEFLGVFFCMRFSWILSIFFNYFLIKIQETRITLTFRFDYRDWS